KCRSLVLWAEIGESSLIRPELVLETTDKVVLIKEKLKAVRDRQKSYADKRRKLLEFEVGDRILERISLVAYRLRLPEKLSSVHDTFHVSNLKKCLADANLHVPLDEIKVDKTLRFVKEPLILSAFVFVDEYFICSRIVIMERNGVLHAMLRQYRVTCGYPWPELEGKGFAMIQELLRSSAWLLPALPLATITGCCLSPSLLNTTTPIASKILSGGIVFQFQQEGIANLRSVLTDPEDQVMVEMEIPRSSGVNSQPHAHT
ncbi:hypothetical protein Tco_0825962, partial [Tanacetum coccineum]